MEEMRSRILRLDEVLILATGRIRSGELRAFEFLLRAISRAGDGYLWFALLAVSLATGRAKAGFVGILAATLATGVSLFLKRTCRRVRPTGATNWSRFVAPDK